MTQFVLAVVLGLLFALGTYLVLRRDIVRVVWGIVIISQAANIYLITMGGLTGDVPILTHGGESNVPVTDPLVQALVLTAIVIGFGTTAFALVLTYRVYQEHGTIDLADLRRGWRERAAEVTGTDEVDTTTNSGTPTTTQSKSDTDSTADSGEPDG